MPNSFTSAWPFRPLRRENHFAGSSCSGLAFDLHFTISECAARGITLWTSLFSAKVAFCTIEPSGLAAVRPLESWTVQCALHLYLKLRLAIALNLQAIRVRHSLQQCDVSLCFPVSLSAFPLVQACCSTDNRMHTVSSLLRRQTERTGVAFSLVFQGLVVPSAEQCILSAKSHTCLNNRALFLPWKRKSIQTWCLLTKGSRKEIRHCLREVRDSRLHGKSSLMQCSCSYVKCSYSSVSGTMTELRVCDVRYRSWKCSSHRGASGNAQSGVNMAGFSFVDLLRGGCR